MQTLILVDRLGKELLPLTDNTPTALLPLAAKPLIEYTLEALAAAGIKQALLVTGPYSEKVQAHVGGGQRWGLEIDYWLGRGEEEPATLLRQLPPTEDSEWLVLRGDVLIAPLLPAFLQAADLPEASTRHAVIDGRPAGMSLFRSRMDAVSAPSWARLLAGAPPAGGDETPIALRDWPGVHLLDSLKNYHQSNLDAVAGRLPGLHLPGREVALGLRQGRNTTLSPRSLTVGVALVGSQCRINPGARLADEVVISDQVIVDRDAHLANAVILPQTYIGELVTISHAIVRGNDLIDVDTGGTIKIVDAFLLSDLREAALTRGLSGGLNRAAGVLLLLLSLPLWPLALLAALLEHPRRPLRARRLRGNRVERGEWGQTRRREFTALEWSTRVPLLAKLPWILGVIAGDLRLVGVEAVTQAEAAQRQAEWELLADGSPAGLIGPTQLFVPAGSPPEERLMSDAFFAGQRDFRKEMTVVWNGFLSLFHPRTWLPVKKS